MKIINLSKNSIEVDKEFNHHMYESFMHEIKNPISILKGNISLLELSNPDLVDTKHWSSLKDNLNHICDLLNDFSSVNESLVIEKEVFNVVPLLYEVYSMFRTAIEDKGIHFNVLKDLDEDFFIYADKGKIKQALINLLKNSLEACDRYDIIQLDCEKKDQTIEISVEDTGCGMDQVQLKTVTTPFVTYKKNGTGLGLAFVNWITAKHMGELVIESEPTVGSKFIIRIPME